MSQPAQKQFHVLNSFTTDAFCGNPAGVVLNADGLSTGIMQSIARQLNLVETVFAFRNPAPGIDYELRYFMPEQELPIAGHPTIAAWACLLQTGAIDPSAQNTFIQKTAAGNIRIEIHGGKIFASQKKAIVTPLPDFFTRDNLAIFNLTPDDIEPGLPAAMVDAGLGHIIFCVRSLDALMKMRFQPELLAGLCRIAGARECQIFCRETKGSGITAHTRNLCPRYGLEDPACGNGNAALGAYFMHYTTPDTPALDLAFEQGHIVSMPALIEVRIRNGDVMIGGTAKMMIEGTIQLT